MSTKRPEEEVEKGEPHPQAPDMGGEESSQDAYSSASFILSSSEEDREAILGA